MGWVATGAVVLALVWGRLSWRSYQRATDAGGRRAAVGTAAAGAALLVVAAAQLLLER